MAVLGTRDFGLRRFYDFGIFRISLRNSAVSRISEIVDWEISWFQRLRDLMGKIPEVDSLGFPEVFVFLRLYEVGDSSEFGGFGFWADSRVSGIVDEEISWSRG